jgi:hypothetical protein
MVVVGPPSKCSLFLFKTKKNEASTIINILHWHGDETLPIINKPKHPKKRGNTKNKMEGPMSKETKEPPKQVNHKGNIKFPNPLLLQEAYQIRKKLGGMEEIPANNIASCTTRNL